jgi:hypothetical protein
VTGLPSKKRSSRHGSSRQGSRAWQSKILAFKLKQDWTCRICTTSDVNDVTVSILVKYLSTWRSWRAYSKCLWGAANVKSQERSKNPRIKSSMGLRPIVFGQVVWKNMVDASKRGRRTPMRLLPTAARWRRSPCNCLDTGADENPRSRRPRRCKNSSFNVRNHIFKTFLTSKHKILFLFIGE